MPRFVRRSKLGLFAPALALALLLSGCTREPGSDDWRIGSAVSVQHGQVDFISPPVLEWSFGSYNSVMCFDRSTVIRMRGTYVIVGAPYYVLLAGLVALGVLPVVASRLRKRRRVEERATEAN